MIPKAIQDMATEAKQEHAKAGAQLPQQATVETTPQPPQQAQPPVAQGQPQQQMVQQIPQQTQIQTSLTPVQTPLANGQRSLLGAAHQSQGAVDWEHKFNVINGKYKAEGQRDRDRIKELEGENQQLKQSQSSAISLHNVADITVHDDEVNKLVSEQKIEEYGLDYWREQIKMQKQVALSTVPQQSSQESSELEALREKVERGEKENFYQGMDQALPNWEQINGSQEFQHFLGQINPLTGMSYNELLVAADQANDVQRALNVFTEFNNVMRGGGIEQPAMNPVAQAQAVPTSGTPVTTGQAQGQYPLSQWMAQMAELPQRGLTPTQLAIEQQKLKDLREKGLVFDDTATHLPQGASSMTFG